MVRRILQLVFYAVTLFCGQASRIADAATIPSWTTPDSTTVRLPAGATTLFRAEGYVTGVFDALLVFDTSESMGRTANGRPKADWAIDGADALIDGLADDIRLGLVQFAGSGALVPSLGSGPLVAELGPSETMPSRRQSLKAALRTLETDGNTTRLDRGISFAANQLTSFPGASESLHLVLITDGASDAEDAYEQTDAAITKGITSVNTIGLPGANTNLLQGIAERGNGQFVDGTDLSGLIDGFRAILDGAESLARLDIMLPNGSVVENVAVGADGRFAVEGLIGRGNNVFQARTYSSLGGDPTIRDLHVIGVPEPASLSIAALAASLMASIPRYSRRSLARNRLRER